MAVAENLVNNKVDHVPEEAKEILKSLARQWDDVLNANELQAIPLKGAMTNVVYQIKWPTKTEYPSRKVVVRIYGAGVDIFFDRDDEIRTFEFMSKNGRGPRLLGRFANGRIEEFIRARTLSASDLRDPGISALIGARLKEFHDLDMPGPKKVHLWDRLRNWLDVSKRLSTPEEAKSFSLATIEEQISILEKELSGDQQRLGFCHNDLQYGNIMLDEETNSVTIIDYEYASYNPVAYDIANHFCEMAANYHTETPHILDYSKYPDLEERKRFVRVYLTSSGNQPSDIEVEQLLQDIEKYKPANHLFWGIWGIISGHVNKIDFNYMEYARQRFQQYWSSKPSLLGSAGPCPDDKTSPSGMASDEPSPDGVNDDKPSPAGVSVDKPSSDGVSGDKPSSDGLTGDKPSSNGLTDDKTSSSGMASDEPSPDGVTDDKPSPAGVSVDKPSYDGVSGDKPSSDGLTGDKPSSNGLTGDKPSCDGVTCNKPSPDGVTGDKPSPNVVTGNKPSPDGVTDDKASPDVTDGETSSEKEEHARNPGVFKKLKKYLTLSFFRSKN